MKWTCPIPSTDMILINAFSADDVSKPVGRVAPIRGDCRSGRLQLDRDCVSYLAPSYEPLIESGQMTLVVL